MLKKGLFAGGGLLVLLLLLFSSRGIWSLLATTKDNIAQAVEDKIPIDVQLGMASKMIEALEPQIKDHKRYIALEELRVADLEKKLKEDEGKLAKRWSDIERMRDDLAKGGSSFVYAGRNYTSQEVETDLAGKFDRFTTSESTVEQNRKVLEFRKKALSAAQDKLRELVAAKEKLELEVEELAAKLKLVEVAKTASELNIDDSQVGKTRDFLQGIKARINVEEKLAQADGLVFGEIRLDEPVENTSILERIADYQAKKDQSETYVDVKPEE